MRFVRELLVGALVAGCLIIYHNAYPVIRLTVNDQRTVSMCAPQDATAPKPWQRGGI